MDHIDGSGAEDALRQRYMAALEVFLDKVRPDPNVLAVVVGGSLAYDVLWEKSDIDVTVVVRDQLLRNESYSIDEDGIVLNLSMTTRSDFRRGLERMEGGSFGQAYFAKGRMVYSVDPSLEEFFEENRTIGVEDAALSVMGMAGMLISDLEKSRKWLVARRDPQYAQYYLILCAETVAVMELCLRGEPASRAAIQKAMAFDPDLMHRVYTVPMSRLYISEEIEEAQRGLEAYLERNIDVISRPVLAFLADGELKTGTLISRHFHEDIHFLILVFDWLVEKGVIERAARTIRITPKGRQVFEEIGYLYAGPV
ncbi:MAG: nucleotidyltransferase [Clostridiaceae bacterium]|nr:nucleotidyltransferase [Clostridiaceae bacterium]